jgi:hypothetical protein
MRRFAAIAVIAATVVTGIPPAPVFAQTAVVATSGPSADEVASIATTINQFPNGGEPLKLAISDLIVKHPKLAASLAAYLKNEPSLTQAQKEAIFAGVSDGLSRLGIVAQVESGMDPLLLALLLGGAAGAGLGIYALSRSTSSSATVSPN